MRTSGNLQESNVNIQIFGERSCGSIYMRMYWIKY